MRRIIAPYFCAQIAEQQAADQPRRAQQHLQLQVHLQRGRGARLQGWFSAKKGRND